MMIKMQQEWHFDEYWHSLLIQEYGKIYGSDSLLQLRYTQIMLNFEKKEMHEKYHYLML